jgi:hypothetical protein
LALNTAASAIRRLQEIQTGVLMLPATRSIKPLREISIIALAS